MSTEEQARRLMAKQRQHEEHLQESLLSRASEEVENLHTQETEEKARELLAHDRQQEEHLQENMLNRSIEELH